MRTEFLYGMWCLFPSASAVRTSESADKLLLMCLVSVSVAPVAPDAPTHSLPARSTSCNLVLKLGREDGAERSGTDDDIESLDLGGDPTGDCKGDDF